MRKRVFGEEVRAADVEAIAPDAGPVSFVRLCGVLVAQALAGRHGGFTVPQITERILVPDGGVDAEFTSPDLTDVPESGGLSGAGRTVYQGDNLLDSCAGA